MTFWRKHVVRLSAPLIVSTGLLAVTAFGPLLPDRAFAKAEDTRAPKNSETPVPAPGPRPGQGAQAHANTLDSLFARLKTARDPNTAAAIESLIWSLWLQSGRADVDALMQQVVAAIARADYHAALSLLDRLVRMAPNYAEGWNKRATVRYLVGDYARSLADIKRVLELEPRHFGAISGTALIRMAQGDKKAALAAYRRALKIHPFLPGARQAVPELEHEVEGDPI